MHISRYDTYECYSPLFICRGRQKLVDGSGWHWMMLLTESAKSESE
jgi:hypothetical protein